MYYTDKALKKTLYSSYIEQALGKKKLVYWSLFLALLTVAVHSLLQTLYNTVLTEEIPQLMLRSFFTIAYTLNLISYIFFAVFFIAKYEKATFNLITKNKWYLLEKMGTNPNKLIVFKTFNTLSSVFSIYIMAYVLALVLAIFYKYTFVVGYLISLFITGFVELLMLVWAIMLLSLFVRKVKQARLYILLIILVQVILSHITGFSELLKDRALMTDVVNVIDPSISPYLLIVFVFVGVSVITTMIIAKKKATYFYSATTSSDISRIDYRTKKQIIPKVGEGKAGKIIAVCVKSVLGTVLAVAVAANLFILVMSISSTTKEFSVLGYIPYIFQSSTMEDDIYRNDLAIFRRVDNSMPIEVGKVIIFTENDETYIEKITDTDGTVYSVDITNYPASAEGNELVKYVVRSNIYGELAYTNRWLGALILFANSLIGQLVMFILPAVLIFFYKPIFDFIKRVTATVEPQS